MVFVAVGVRYGSRFTLKRIYSFIPFLLHSTSISVVALV